jgi:hypothetical protein
MSHSTIRLHYDDRQHANCWSRHYIVRRTGILGRNEVCISLVLHLFPGPMTSLHIVTLLARFPLASVRIVIEKVQGFCSVLVIVCMSNLQVRFVLMSHELEFEL